MNLRQATHFGRGVRVALVTAVIAVLATSVAEAQRYRRRYYPRGYGAYGWGGWGGVTDPAAGLMAGLGSYARGAGVYELEDAKAQAINLDTMLKWNKALRQRQQELREEQQKQQAQRAAERKARADEYELEDGTTLNNLMARIYDFDPGAAKTSQAKAPIGTDAVREIPFEWDTEAITFSIDEMTAQGGLPASLDSPRFTEQKNALRKAVDKALDEEKKGNVSAATKNQLSDAIRAFRNKFQKTVPDFDPTRNEAEQYFVTLASLTRMLNDPSMRKILNELSAAKEVRVGDLIGFMHAYNLRFGPATTPRQIEIYRGLARPLGDVADTVGGKPAPRDAGQQDRKSLQSAAKDAFKGMDWKHLDAQGREPSAEKR